MSKILRKIGQNKRIARKKNKWKKSKIGSALIMKCCQNVSVWGLCPQTPKMLVAYILAMGDLIVVINVITSLKT